MRKREILANKKYLLIPIADVDTRFASKKQIQYFSIRNDNKIYEEYEIVLSETPCFYGCLYLEPYRGSTIELCLEGGEEDLIDSVEISDNCKDEDSIYKEAWRPFIHLTPKRGFMNDPNGLFYYEGIYHYFAQLNPYGMKAGNTHWMHAVSRDLMHWKEMPYALLPDKSGLKFSGGGVVDLKNTSGLQSGENPPIFLFYTAAGSKSRWSQGKAFEIATAVSYDGGETFVEYSGNPVIHNRSFFNRDPKVIWDDESEKWLMMIYLDNDRYQLFSSSDLLHWKEGDIVYARGSAECPDLFFLFLDGDRHKRKLILWFSPDNYMVGKIKNGHFCQETELILGPSRRIYTQFGLFRRPSGGYAAQTYTNSPGGRVIQQMFLRTAEGTLPFSNCASIPNEIKLISTQNGPRLTIFPVREISNMYDRNFSFQNKSMEELEHIPTSYFSEAMDISLTFTVTKGKPIAFSLRGILIVYQPEESMLLLPTGAYKIKTSDDCFAIRIITDRLSMEIYTASGEFNTAVQITPDSNAGILPVYMDPGTGICLDMYTMNSSWETK